jgi:hypothetical protein
VSVGADRTYRPSHRFRTIHGDGVSPRQAERTLISILYNHDTVPDLVTLTCELSASSGRALTFAEAARIVAADGAAFDADGWFVDRAGGDEDGGREGG